MYTIYFAVMWMTLGAWQSQQEHDIERGEIRHKIYASAERSPVQSKVHPRKEIHLRPVPVGRFPGEMLPVTTTWDR